jgi:hypothetical protein
LQGTLPPTVLSILALIRRQLASNPNLELSIRLIKVKIESTVGGGYFDAVLKATQLYIYN